MAKVFGMFLLVFGLTCVADAIDANVETELMSKMEESLDAALRCRLIIAPIGNGFGNMAGKELGLWWAKRGYKKDHILPLIEKSKSLVSDEDASNKIKIEVAVFINALSAEPAFKKCPEKSKEFFENIEVYIEYVTALDLNDNL